jgi:hypothetical protein
MIKLNEVVIFPMVLYGYWSVMLREERRLKVFENRVLRRIFGAKEDEVIGNWRKIHNDELQVKRTYLLSCHYFVTFTTFHTI